MFHNLFGWSFTERLKLRTKQPPPNPPPFSAKREVKSPGDPDWLASRRMREGVVSISHHAFCSPMEMSLQELAGDSSDSMRTNGNMASLHSTVPPPTIYGGSLPGLNHSPLKETYGQQESWESCGTAKIHGF